MKSFSKSWTNLLIFILLCSIICISVYGNGDFVQTSAMPIYGGGEQSGELTLMINVYWGTEYIEQMLDTLDDFGVKTTFFVGGVWAVQQSQMLEEIYLRGHEIGNHAYSHKDMSKLDYKQSLDEIANTNKLISNITHTATVQFTPPSGAFSPVTLKCAKELNMNTIMWSLDTIDWRDKNVDIIYERATKKAKSGSIILMHPTKCTAEALPKILKYYKDNNLKVVTVKQLLS